LTTEEKRDEVELPENAKVFRADKVRDNGNNPEKAFEFEFANENLLPGSGFTWRGYLEEMTRLQKSERLIRTDETLAYKFFLEDNGGTEITSFWEDTAGKVVDMVYAVQTNSKIIERCLLMTTSPGDLVLDPTCGSGTTAYVAEHWGRRWITVDTSRVAVSLARQRLLTAKFPHYRLHDPALSPAEKNTFVYDTVPHITLKSIAQNRSLDAIFAKHEPLLDAALAGLNALLPGIGADLRQKLLLKLKAKERAEGKKSLTDADQRRWNLPPEAFAPWTVPFDTDEELYPAPFAEAVRQYRRDWAEKMAAVNACIQANAEPVELVDKPDVVPKVVRVSGPFTVEGVMPAEISLGDTSPIDEPKGELETFDVATNAVSFQDNMFGLLKREGVNFVGNRHRAFADLRPYANGNGLIQFEGEWLTSDDTDSSGNVAVSLGPQHGPVTGWQVENVLRMAFKRGFDEVVFAGFSFTAEAQAVLQDDDTPNLRLHLAQIRPDVQMGDLLKNTGSGQVFSVFGLPRAQLLPTPDGQFKVEMQGVDIYDPVTNSIHDSRADKVAAWFLDTDYDGRTFCITQAFFPNRTAWAKLEKALKGVIDADKFEALSGTLSLPFPAGEHRRVALKVIDPRGNDVMKILSLDQTY